MSAPVRPRAFRALAALLVCCAAAQAAGILRLWPSAGLAQAADSDDADTDTPASDTPASYAEPVAVAAGEKSVAPDAACPPDKDFEHETGLSQYEIKVLRSLSRRREELEGREQELEVRVRAAEAAELRIDAQIAELRQLDDGLRDTLERMKVIRDERLENLVRVYAAMKPKDAARIFETLPEGVLLGVAERMKYAELSAIMAKMSAERARTLTGLLAARVEIPGSADELEERAG